MSTARRTIVAILSVFCLVFAPMPAFGQATFNHRPARQVVPRDSLKNGAIIGALIGAAAFGGFTAALCHAYQAKGDPSCVPDALRFAAIGAAIGSGTGLVIDAARHDRGVAVRVTVRF